MKNILIFIITAVFSTIAFPQKTEYPKLVVGIVIDQMRYDYIVKYKNYYGQEGFNRLINNGSNFTFAHFNYIPTATGPGHSSIYTGTTPFFHGIIGNDWYDKQNNKTINCVEDNHVKGLGDTSKEGRKSPKRLLANTITDQLKIATNGKSKVICISIKDRGAILPGGYSADAAYWYSDKNGKFISSTYYMNELPQWVNEFNSWNLASKFASHEWQLTLPDSAYSVNFPDENDAEEDPFNEGKTSFPHSLKYTENKYNKLKTTPSGNQLVLEFTKAAIKNENLGENTVPDFLAVSFSSTDHIGHAFGPNSVEVMDTYIKLDQQVADLLSTLDKQVENGNYLLFLTADHGVMETIGYLKKLRLPGSNLKGDFILDSLRNYTEKEYRDSGLVKKIKGTNIYLDYSIINKNNFNISDVEQDLVNYLLNNIEEVASAYTRNYLQKNVSSRESSNLLLNGFNLKRSGDIYFHYQPYHIYGHLQGSTHGSAYSYDTHIPLIFYGWNVPKQEINKQVYIVDIAPTIANLLKITEPNKNIGIPILDAANPLEN